MTAAADAACYWLTAGGDIFPVVDPAAWLADAENQRLLGLDLAFILEFDRLAQNGDARGLVTLALVYDLALLRRERQGYSIEFSTPRPREAKLLSRIAAALDRLPGAATAVLRLLNTRDEASAVTELHTLRKQLARGEEVMTPHPDIPRDILCKDS